MDPSKADKQDFLVLAMQARPSEPILGPVSLSLQFFFPRPKSHYRTGKYSDQLKANAPLLHISKPDADNLVKLVKDALNGVFWHDDSQVCVLYAEKKYSLSPRTEVELASIA